MNDPDYQQINALYKDFVPQNELSAEQKYFPFSFIPSANNSEETASILASMPTNSKNSTKKVAVYVRKNKQTDNTFPNVISNKENVIDVDVANDSKAKNLLCVSCMQNVLIPCHDKCLAHHRLNASRTLTTKFRTPKSSDTTYVLLKTRFSEKLAQSKTLYTTYIVSKPKIDVGSASKAKNKVSSAPKTNKRNLQEKSLSTYMKNKIRTSRIWQKWFESRPNVVWSPVNTNPNAHNSCSSEKPSVSIKKWVVKFLICPYVVSSYVIGSPACLVEGSVAMSGGLLSGIHGMFSERRLLDFVDVFGYFHDAACLYLVFMHVVVSLYRCQCVVMIPSLVAPRVFAMAGCDRLVSEPMVIE
nr:hypothetical protein [Tanacetum cinerariifolium]